MAFDLDKNELIKIRPRMETLAVSRGRTVLSMDRDGFIRNSEHGLFFWETRVLSRYELFVNGQQPKPVALSNFDQNSWFGYYVFKSVIAGEKPDVDLGSGQIQPETIRTLELTIARDVSEDGLRETLEFTNYTQQALKFEFAILVDADFEDMFETTFRRVQKGCKEKIWHSHDEASASLDFEYSVEREFKEQNEVGRASFTGNVRFEVRSDEATPQFDGEKILFSIELSPLKSWKMTTNLFPALAGKIEERHFSESFNTSTSRSSSSSAPRIETRFEDPGRPALQSVVLTALERARQDLLSLRLADTSTRDGWTMAAGTPIYTALFGRDVLTSSWQAAMLGPEMMAGSLQALASKQGTRKDDWRDEEPGKMLHEAHTGPMSMLNFFPRSRYYGSSTTSILFPLLVSELWHWTADREQVAQFIEPALKALQWMDRFGDLEGDAFYEYQQRSKRGTRNQGWKDSDDAIVDENGRLVDAPVAMAEEQAFAYVSKRHFAEVLWWFGRRDEAKKLLREAGELKKRFNDSFWLPESGFIAMGLDSFKKPIRSIGSDAGHCLATGILDDSLVPLVADRLMHPDLFSGWGIRTLSSDHPAYNPYSYHRGSIWPVENGTFALGFVRCGLHRHAETLSRGMFEATSLFEAHRLPELFSGHPRDERHPFPALYPRANVPQAWSASSLFCIIQSLLGLYPYAPAHLLIIDPHLPPWLPQFVVRDLRIGNAKVTLSFSRHTNGRTTFEILDLEGPLKVLRQPNPWSLTASTGERAKGFAESFMQFV